MQNSPSTDLYNLLVTRNFEPEILDVSGKPVSDPDQAEMFSFDWKTVNQNYGTVVALLGQDQDLQIYYGDNLTKELESEDKNDWYQFLRQLKSFATRNMLTFDIKNLNRLKYTMQSMSAITEGLLESYYGNRRVSYSDQPKKTRLVIKHSRPLGEGEARYRYIESLFVETDQGERFRLPFTKLVGGKAMARHIAEGGTPYDDFGRHIAEMVEEMNVLSRFVRSTRNKNYDGESARMVEAAVRHYQDLKTKAKRMISQRGYGEARSEFVPTQDNAADSLDDIRNLFIEQSLDSRIEEALPILARITKPKEKPMREIEEFETWAESVTEGTWAVPDSQTAENQLRELLAQELPVGTDATNATEQIYGLIGDDKLFDDLYELAQQDPEADARPLIIKRLDELGYELDLPAATEPPTSEDLDTDGVMMTRPSTMSNESIERLRYLSKF
jgi:hypothetical protein